MIKRYVLGGLAFVGLLQPAIASETRGDIEPLIVKHAAANNVPAALVHRIIIRESRYNARAVGRGGALGLMQIKHGTARALGYAGPATGLLDADTNLTYGVRYLAGAYRAANGDQNRTVGYYARGYYYEAKRRGLHRNLAPVAAEEAPVLVSSPATAQQPSIFTALFQPAQPVQAAAVAAVEEAAVPLPPRRDRRIARKKTAPGPSLAAGNIPSPAGAVETVTSIGSDPVQRTGALPSAQTGSAGPERSQASAAELRSTPATGRKSGSVKRTQASVAKSSGRDASARAEGAPAKPTAETSGPSAPATRRARSAEPKGASGGDRFERTASAPPDGPGNRP